MQLFLARGGAKKNNCLINFLSNLSLEIYLSHMLVFRVVQKFNRIFLIKNGCFEYMITVIIVLLGTIIFSYILKNMLAKLMALKK